MRYHSLRFDIWLCLLLSFLLSQGVLKMAKPIYENKYEEHKKEHIVESNEIGGVADHTIYKAQNIDDLLSHDIFTIVSPGIEYRNKGAGYYHGMYLYAVTLPSNEIVACRINNDSVISTGDSIFSGDNILPVGQIIKADLSDDSSFLGQIEFKEKLSSHDFYVDMVGEAEIKSEAEFIETPLLGFQILTIIITFPIFHAIGFKLGIFPTFFSFKNKKEKEWD